MSVLLDFLIRVANAGEEDETVAKRHLRSETTKNRISRRCYQYDFEGL